MLFTFKRTEISQSLGNVSLQSNDVITPYYNVALFHQEDHQISQIFNLTDESLHLTRLFMRGACCLFDPSVYERTVSNNRD